jgi:putative ABC transport system substrate-binding protein
VAKSAINTIPIVMLAFPDPVGEGMVARLARPGGNITGLSSLGPELGTKRLEILKDAVLKLARVGVLQQPGTLASVGVPLNEIKPAALALKLKLEAIDAQPNPKALESAFQTAKQKQMGAIMTQSIRPFFVERKRIVELAGKNWLPAIYPQKEFVDQAASCPMGSTPLTSSGAPLVTWTRS